MAWVSPEAWSLQSLNQPKMGDIQIFTGFSCLVSSIAHFDALKWNDNPNWCSLVMGWNQLPVNHPYSSNYPRWVYLDSLIHVSKVIRQRQMCSSEHGVFTLPPTKYRCWWTKNEEQPMDLGVLHVFAWFSMVFAKFPDQPTWFFNQLVLSRCGLRARPPQSPSHLRLHWDHGFPSMAGGVAANHPSHGWPWLSLETAMVTWGSTMTEKHWTEWETFESSS